jgi:hypothetical protein
MATFFVHLKILDVGPDWRAKGWMEACSEDDAVELAKQSTLDKYDDLTYDQLELVEVTQQD